MATPKKSSFERRVVGSNVWLGRGRASAADLEVRPLAYEVLPNEAAVGLAQWEEIERAAREKEGDLVIILLGGRGAQAMYRRVAEIARTEAADAPEWPFVAGRFLRPDTIVSLDVEPELSV